MMVQQSRIENTILASLFFKEDYTRKVLPFIKEEYFGNRVEQLLFGEVFKFVEKYNNLPTKDAILIELNSRRDINEEELQHLKDYVVAVENLKQMNNGYLKLQRSFVKTVLFTTQY
jgi:hypothetical protein